MTLIKYAVISCAIILSSTFLRYVNIEQKIGVDHTMVRNQSQGRNIYEAITTPWEEKSVEEKNRFLARQEVREVLGLEMANFLNENKNLVEGYLEAISARSASGSNSEANILNEFRDGILDAYVDSGRPSDFERVNMMQELGFALRQIQRGQEEG